MRALEISVEPSSVRTVVVHLDGELDAISVVHLNECLQTVEPGFTTVILDLKGLTFLDSVGIGCLLRLHQTLDETARLLQLRNVTGQPQRTLEMSALDQHLCFI
jgi:anti-anti-sigma factor